MLNEKCSSSWLQNCLGMYKITQQNCSTLISPATTDPSFQLGIELQSDSQCRLANSWLHTICSHPLPRRSARRHWHWQAALATRGAHCRAGDGNEHFCSGGGTRALRRRALQANWRAALCLCWWTEAGVLLPTRLCRKLFIAGTRHQHTERPQSIVLPFLRAQLDALLSSALRCSWSTTERGGIHCVAHFRRCCCWRFWLDASGHLANNSDLTKKNTSGNVQKGYNSILA